MANTIAGNVGVVGATVQYIGATSGVVTSDASSNYVTPLLAAGTYIIYPIFPESSFGPTSQSVTIVATNITGINFTFIRNSDTEVSARWLNKVINWLSQI